MEKLDLIAGATIALDKPLTWSSFSLVNKFRCEACRYLGIKKLKVGHAGTLDPLATGVMILCTGKHTKRIDELQAGRKEYIADIRLGQTTPTFDMETAPDAYFPTEHITREAVEEALKGFIGTIEQVPPAFSAVKVDAAEPTTWPAKDGTSSSRPRPSSLTRSSCLTTPSLNPDPCGLQQGHLHPRAGS